MSNNYTQEFRNVNVFIKIDKSMSDVFSINITDSLFNSLFKKQLDKNLTEKLTELDIFKMLEGKLSSICNIIEIEEIEIFINKIKQEINYGKHNKRSI